MEKTPHKVELISRAIRELADEISKSFTPEPNPYMPDVAPFTHFTDDDTDYQPARADLLHGLVTLYADDDPDWDGLFEAVRTCRGLTKYAPLAGAECIHMMALDMHTILDCFAPSYDDCPNLQD